MIECEGSNDIAVRGRLHTAEAHVTARAGAGGLSY